MTRGWHDLPVPVRVRDEQVQVGECADVVGLEPVVLPGCVAYVDPATPWRPPCLVVVDTGRAAEVLNELWGPGVVDLARDGADGSAEVRDAGPGLQDLVSLGTARWVERWQPYPLDPGLLRLDVLAARTHCQELLDPDDDPEEGTATAVLADALDDVESWLAAPRGVAEPAGSAPGWVGDLGRPGAVAASVPRVIELGGRATADWDRVAAGTISRAESAVHWSVEDGTGGALLHVVAIAAGQPGAHPAAAAWAPPPAARRLRARAYVPGWPLPLVEVELTPRGEAGAWAGAAELTPDVVARLDAAGPQHVLLDVALPALPVPPRTGRAALRAKATRWGVRCVSAARLAAHVRAGAARPGEDTWGPQLRAQVPSAGRQAVELWRVLDEEGHAATIRAWVSEEDLGRPAPLGLAERRALRDGRAP